MPVVTRSRFVYLLLGIFLNAFISPSFAQPCPSLNSNATLTSPDCASGVTPCTVCPGDEITLNATGTGLQPGMCINWYYGNTNTFNPLNGEGQLLGCAQVTPATPSSCLSCPLTLALFVDACGDEANNEILALWSGSGFYVDDLMVDFDGANNVGGGNDDIGSGCPWTEPSSAATSSIQSICPNAVVVGAGPGEIVPPGVPVIVFTSAGYDYNYNFGSLCPLSPVIYVMQNGCTRSTDAFTNGPGAGSVTTVVSLSCGCGDATTYNIGSLTGGNGAFVTDGGFPPFYGNAGCGFPPLPGGGGGGSGGSPLPIPPFTFTVTEPMCNGGPYYAVGVIEPVPPGCNPTQTNYLGFDVPCPQATLQPGPDLCESAQALDLDVLADPNVPNGNWMGEGVSGGSFSPAGLSGAYELTFTPAGACGLPSTTTVQVFPAPFVNFDAVPPVCPGQAVTLTANFIGQAPYSFDLYAGSDLVGSYVVTENAYSFAPEYPSATTLYSISAFEDALCPSAGDAVNVLVTPPPVATLSLNGPAAFCAGQSASLNVDLSGSTPPFTFTPSVNGVNQSPITAGSDPFSFSLPVYVNGTANITLTNVNSGACMGIGAGAVAITTIEAPSAYMAPETRSICTGASDTISILVDGSGAYTLDWLVNGAVQAPISVTSPGVNIPVTPLAGMNTYSLTGLTGGACPGIVSGADTIFAVSTPSATFEGDTTICGAGMAHLIVNADLNGPITANYSINGVSQPAVSANDSPLIINELVDSTSVFFLESVNVNGCVGAAAELVTAIVNTNPTATLTGGGQLCFGGPGDTITVTFTGTGPWTFEYTVNNILQPPVTTSQNPWKLYVTPGMYTRYQLVSVSDPLCAGTVSGLAEFYIFVASSASMQNDISLCDPGITSLVVNVTGTAPFIITYAIDGVVQPPDTTDEGPLLIPINITETTVYTLVGIQSPGCEGVIQNDSTVVTINYPPQFGNVNQACNPALQTYTVTFNATNAELPLTLVSGSGSFAGSTFTSTPIPYGTGYSFVFHDANDCGDVTVAGANTCNCTTNSGTMNLNTLHACVNAPVTATFNNDANLDGNDILRYVLRTNANLPLGTILAWNSTPTFNYGGAIMPDVTYYISAIAGNNDGGGQVDLTDPCMRVSEGVPVIWHSPPTASLSASDTVLCMGEATLLTVQFNGNPPFSFTPQIGGINQTPVTGIATNSYSWNYIANGDVQIGVQSVSDAYCTQGSVGAPIQIHSLQPALAGPENIVCDDITATYSVSFNMISGQTPFSASGNAGSFIGNIFTSAPIPFGQPYFIEVEDAAQCGIDTISGISVCQCLNDGGVLTAPAAAFCFGQAASLAPTIGSNVPAGDQLEYWLTTTDDPATWTVLTESAMPVFPFINGLYQPGTVYYVVALSGNPSANGVDPNDPCIDYSNAVPVSWRSAVSAQISGADHICEGETAIINLQFSGALSYNYTIAANNQAQNPQISNLNSIQWSVTPNKTTTYTFASVLGDGCPATVSGSAQIIVDAVPQFEYVFTNCDPTYDWFTLELHIDNGPAVNSGYTVTGVTGALTDSVFVSQLLPSGSAYAVTVTTPAGCSDTAQGDYDCGCLTDISGLQIASITGCVGETLTMSTTGVFFNDANDVIQYLLCEDPLLLPAGVISVSNTPVFSFINGMTPGQEYYVLGVSGDSLPNGSVDPLDNCLSQTNTATIAFFEPPTAALAGDTTICVGEDARFTAYFTGQGPFQFVYTVNGVAQPALNSANSTFQIAVNNVQQDIEIQLLSISDAYCDGSVSGVATITAQSPPEVSISGEKTMCPGDSLLITVHLTGATVLDSLVVSSNPGGADLIFLQVSDGFSFYAIPSVSTQYLIESATIEGYVCEIETGGSALATISPLLVQAQASNYNGYGVSCAGDNDGQITVVATGGGGNYSINWADFSGDAFQQNNVAAGEYAFTVTDQYGCSGENTIVLTEPSPVSAQISLATPRCDDGMLGEIIIDTILNGVSPLNVTIGGQVYPVAGFPIVSVGLPTDEYAVMLSDANGCLWDTIIFMPPPPTLLVDAGPDLSIALGDSVDIQVFTTSLHGVDTVIWSPALGLSATDTLAVSAKPLSSTAYRVWVRDSLGCEAFDELTIAVRRDNRWYIPGAIMPGSGTGNDQFTVYAGDEVLKVNYLQVFDRWGEMIFEQKNFLPNDRSSAWTGTWRGKNVLPGVYVYVAELLLINGQTIQVQGDLTVAR